MKCLIFFILIIFLFNSCKKLRDEVETNKVFLSGKGLTDIDGNYYPSVIIGNQEWMANNLKVTRFNTGDSILFAKNDSIWDNLAYLPPFNTLVEIPDNPIYSFAGFDSTSNPNFGYYYNVKVIKNDLNVCPVGWHIPSSNEWNSMIDYVSDPETFGLYSKSTGILNDSTGYWDEDINYSSNETQLSIEPSGFYSTVLAYNLKIYQNTCLASSTFGTYNTKYGSYPEIKVFLMDNKSYKLKLFETNMLVGLPIRCVKD
ncbi:MAG: fibrobacter succinogenes major paralogous domain-containing protein [Flavobacteriia bacterium]|nr:fibrobacter succinogenes major paralogous domain-containing protein [Flavobacteriia bacterium]